MMFAWIVVICLLAVIALDLYLRKLLRRYCLVEADATKPGIVPHSGDPLVDSFYSFYRVLVSNENDMIRINRDYVDRYFAKSPLQMCQTNFFGLSTLIIWDPDLFKQMLLSEKENFPKIRNMVASFDEIMGESVVLVSGEQWKRQRKVMNPAFHYDHLNSILPHFTTVSRRLIDYWDKLDGNLVEIHEWLSKATLDALGKAGFGFDFHALDGGLTEQYHQYSSILKEGFSNPLRFFSWYERLKTRSNIEFFGAKDRFFSFLLRIVDEKRKLNKIEKQEQTSDLLDLMLQSHEDDSMTDRELSHNMFLFFLAGHETSSSALTFVLHALSQYPYVQEKVHQELNQVFGEGIDIEPTYTQLSKLEYLQWTIKETMRMWPPVPGLSRIASKNTVMNGYFVPEGALVVLDSYKVHWDERYWSQPDKFLPERFSPENSKGRHPFAWMPFGAGPRACLGANFALLEMKCTLAMLLKRYAVKPGEKTLKIVRAISLQPQCDYAIRIEKRLAQ